MTSFEKIPIGKPEQWLIEAGKNIGLNFFGFTHEITTGFKDHCIKRHGNPKIHGAATINELDFDRIPGIIKTPDYAIIGAIRKQTLLNIYVKIDNGITILYFEEVLISRKNKAFRGKTLYKVTRPLTLEEVLKSISRNAKTDITKVIKIKF